MPALPELRDELLAMLERELAAVDHLSGALDAAPEFAAELDRRLEASNAALVPVLADWADAPPEAVELVEINARNAERLAEILAGGPWPGLRLVGADGADAAWMLAQHADRLGPQREAWLPLLAEAVATGDADPRHLATLADRIAALAGRPQPYGTIAERGEDGFVTYATPVDDPDGLDARRTAIGLVPMAGEAPYLDDGDLVPFGPDRGDVPVNQWPMVLEGHVSVEAALEGGVRHVHRVWATRPGDRRLRRLRALARERGVLIDEVDPGIVEEVSQGRTHGGVIALVGPRREASVEQLLAAVGEGSLVVMLDGIEDPFNHGQAVRALYAAGVDGLVVRRSWETAVTTVARASAGTSELLPTARVTSAEEAASACRAAGMRVGVAVADEAATDLDDADLTGGMFLLVGGERRGVTRSFVEQADVRLRIAYGRERAPDLGAATAAAVIAFAAARQRRRLAPPASGSRPTEGV